VIIYLIFERALQTRWIGLYGNPRPPAIESYSVQNDRVVVTHYTAQMDIIYVAMMCN
jgi:hypothetical protein